MPDLLKRLREKQRRGSKPRVHRLTQGSSEEVAARLTAMIAPLGKVTANDRWMPNGFCQLDEAELHRSTHVIRDQIVCDTLRDWWLAIVRGKQKTPNFDIASTCHVFDSEKMVPGLLLVEAKAHEEELKKEVNGKPLGVTPSDGRRANHERIGYAISQCGHVLRDSTGHRWNLQRDSHYQMSNRFAWATKLAQLGFPVILVYLGFVQANEMSDTGKKPYTSSGEWQEQIMSHSAPLFPSEIWNEKLTVDGQPLIPLIRSTKIPHDRPIEGDVVFCK